MAYFWQNPAGTLKANPRSVPNVEIKDGRFEVDGMPFPLSGKGMKDLFRRKKVRDVVTFSSVDFPEEYGAPEGFDARAVLKKALAW